MEANTFNLREIFLNSTRYLVPLFQRKYCWEPEKQLEPLWEDVISLVESQENSDPTPHFLGAMVLTQVPTSSKRLNTREIIDGQQRLTTLQILIAAFRDVAKEKGFNEQYKLLRNLTFNNEDIISNEKDRLKIYPTNVDREAFKAVMENSSLDKESLIVKAYNFFVKQTEDWLNEVKDIGVALEALIDILLESLIIVLIDLDNKDNSQVIFEVLNARGEPLQPSDLIKNKIFQKAKQDIGLKQDDDFEYIQRLHDKYWSPFDAPYWGDIIGRGRTSQIKLDAFFSHYLTIRQGIAIRRSNLFVNFRDFIDEQLHNANAINSFLALPSENTIKTTKDLLRDIKKYSEIYERFDNYPKGDPYELFFYKLDATQTTTVYPLLLYLFGSRSKELPDAQLVEILGMIESYIMRRMIVGLTPKTYNQTFVRMLQAVANDDPTQANHIRIVRDFLTDLSGDSQLWPDDERVSSALVDEDLYRPNKQLGKNKVKIILESLEATMRSPYREDLDVPRDLTIEHLIPQRWERNWPLPTNLEGLERDEAQKKREASINRIGNLTLVTSEFNASLSNGSWEQKRAKIKSISKLELNAEFSETEEWNEEKIDDRSRRLAEIAIKKWPGPSIIR